MAKIKPNPKDGMGALKPNLSLVPTVATVYESLVYGNGARKYGRANWRERAVLYTVYLAAAKRHIEYLESGEDLDRESGLPHEAHARACLGIVQDARMCGRLIDDRPAFGEGAVALMHKLDDASGYAKARGKLVPVPCMTVGQFRRLSTERARKVIAERAMAGA